MKILVLNGSPRPAGSTAKMIAAFREGAESAGHSVTVIDAYKQTVKGCLGCEFCHGAGEGVCVQKDDMQGIHAEMKDSDMLILASPIYYHNISGPLKTIIDRFYAILYPERPERLSKIGMILASGDPDVYEGPLVSFYGDFVGFSKMEDMGVHTADSNEIKTPEKIEELRAFGASL